VSLQVICPVWGFFALKGIALAYLYSLIFRRWLMGTLRKKTIKGNIYYYYVESKRIDGKPKNVNQKYLGTAEALLKLKNQASAPLQDEALYSHIKSYGDVVLLYDLFARLGIVDIMDAHAAKRKQGASVGQYVMVEAINRAVSPSSTDSLQDWYAGTCLPLLMGLPPKTCSFHLLCGTCRLLEVSIASSPSLHRHCPTSLVLFDDPTSRFPFDSLTYSACRSYSIH